MQVDGCLVFQFCIAFNAPKETLNFLHTPISTLFRWLLRKETFPKGTTYLSKILNDSQYVYIEIKYEEAVIDRHRLQYLPIPTMEIDYSDVRKQTMESCIKGTQESCQQLT